MQENCEICGQVLILVGEQDKGRCVDCYTKDDIEGFAGCPGKKDRKILALAELYNIMKCAGKIEGYI